MAELTATYKFVYLLAGSEDSAFTIDTSFLDTTSLQDTADGAADGETIVGETTNWNYGIVRLVGFSSTGDPVVDWENGRGYYLVSDSADLEIGADIGFTTEGVYAYCFAAGTQIACAGGSTAVESLRIGERILTADGRTVAVKWIGRQTLSTRFAGHRAQPVRIRAGALGDGVPHADLTVTADHGMILDGLVVNAGALVNGTTITLVPLAALPARVTYYHVETADHDVILANGAPAETFVDYAGRAAFDNHAEYLALYGTDHGMAELPLPRITSARQVPAAIRARLGRDTLTADRSRVA
ncbi:Hint domain-containing protein [Roseicyclus mahoneyensis]|uniref:Hint domain-containing protein n=1 Tax=Roseicyclus mahoneyensis TaxID=164332 RepID=A0A316GM36_9RHOB|nr:Hint domain-containing protein [Roseicyclus mahoneyensis]PWK62257.1 Hint domain-containing protein [Roseicyclus mahoneyensis]